MQNQTATTVASCQQKETVKANSLPVFEHYLGPGKKRGKDFLFSAPDRPDTNPSLSYNAKNLLYHDFGSGEGGDVFSFVAKREGLDVKSDFPRVLEIAAGLAGVSIPERNGTNAPSLSSVKLSKPSPTTREELAQQYGLTWEDFSAANCTVRGPDVVYPILTPSGQTVEKLKSTKRDANGKRKTRFAKSGTDGPRGLFGPDVINGCSDALAVVLCGGEEKCLAVYTHCPNYAAASLTTGEKRLSPETIALLRERLRPTEIIVSMDADDTGRKAAGDICAQLVQAFDVPVRFVDWPDDSPSGHDLNDVLIADGPEGLDELLKNARVYTSTASSNSAGDVYTQPNHEDTTTISEAERAKAAGILENILSMQDLAKIEFPPQRWAIEGLIPEAGLTVIAGAPKLGKSWLCLGIASAVASGGYAFGSLDYQTAKGSALYLALEDNDRRLQSRLLQLQQVGEAIPSGFYRATTWPRIGQGCLEGLHAWCDQHPDAGIIIVDTLARVRPARRSRGDVYQEDADLTASLQKLGMDRNVAVCLVTHTRKLDDDDVFNTIQGSMGITASADVVMAVKRGRNSVDGELHVTGRDIEEAKLALRFDRGTWTVLGDADEHQLSESRRALLEAIRETPGLTPKELAELTGQNSNTTKTLLRKLETKDEMVRSKAGRYYISTINPINSINREESERADIHG